MAAMDDAAVAVAVAIATASSSSSPLLTSHKVLDGAAPLSWIRAAAGDLKMMVVEEKGGAMALMLVSLLLLGTWPALLTFLERRGRLPQHTYLDYSITNFLAAVLIVLSFGLLGPGTPNFFTQLTQDNWPSVMFAMAGGVVLSVGNLSTQYAWAYVGLSVTEVISCSMVVVIGTYHVLSISCISRHNNQLLLGQPHQQGGDTLPWRGVLPCCRHTRLCCPCFQRG